MIPARDVTEVLKPRLPGDEEPDPRGCPPRSTGSIGRRAIRARFRTGGLASCARPSRPSSCPAPAAPRRSSSSSRWNTTRTGRIRTGSPDDVAVDRELLAQT